LEADAKARAEKNRKA